MTRHYIEVDAKNYITKGFSTEFEQPKESDICINEDGDRHFELNGVINPPLINVDGTHFYKFINGEIIETTEEEKQAEIETFPKVINEQTELTGYLVDLDYRLCLLELGV